MFNFLAHLPSFSYDAKLVTFCWKVRIVDFLSASEANFEKCIVSQILSKIEDLYAIRYFNSGTILPMGMKFSEKRLK